MQKTALEYAELGWKVFPIHTIAKNRCTCGQECGRDAGKHPVGYFEKDEGDQIVTYKPVPNGLNDATNDPETIKKWWSIAPFNIGIRTGEESGIFVLDPDGEIGLTSLAELEAANGFLPETVTAITGGNGKHLFFKHPGFYVKSNNQYWESIGFPKIDVKGEGGYVVAAPSKHRSGNRYKWEPGHAPGEVEIATAPEWLLELIQEAGKTPDGTKEPFDLDKAMREGFPAGMVNVGLVSAVGYCISKKYPQMVTFSTLRTIIEAGGGTFEPALTWKHVKRLYAAYDFKDDYEFVDIENTEMTAMTYIVRPYIPKQNVTLIHAGTATAKSLFIIKIAGIVSAGGGDVPYVGKVSGGKVLYFNTEDVVRNTFLPRLNSIKYNVKNFMIYNNIENPILYNDPRVEKMIAEGGYSLVVIDILKDMVDGDFDVNTSRHVRQAINFFKVLADRYDLAVVMITHNNKSKGADGAARVQGSNDWYTAARSVLELQYDKDTKVINVIHNKTNHNLTGAAFGFKVGQKDLGIDARGITIDAPYIEEFCEPTKTKEQIDAEFAGEKSISKEEQAIDLILKYLTENGEAEWSDIEEYVKARNISASTILRARQAAEKEQMIAKRKIGSRKVVWYRIPDDMTA
jgi:RecA-family ATPase